MNGVGLRNRIVWTVAVVLAVFMLVMGLTVGKAHAAGPRTTIVYSPHQDDETLRLSGYVSTAVARGDRLILVAVTDGEDTYLTNAWGWSAQMMKDSRILEQEHAWAALTQGRGTIIRLHLPDGGVAAQQQVITDKAVELNNQYGYDTENYVAADASDYHPDHRATVAGVRAANLRIVRTALDRGNHNGMPYPSVSPADTTLAANAYRAIGWISVPDSFANLLAENGTSYVH
jgi:LmbE family N-acetylglucosaminyl deacetylase